MQAGPQRNRKSRRRMLQLRTAENVSRSNWSCRVLRELLECVFFCNAVARCVVPLVAVWLVRSVAVWLVRSVAVWLVRPVAV